MKQKILLCRTSDFDGLEGLSLLSEERKNEINRYKQTDDKMRCLAAGLLLKYVLKEKAETIKTARYGKPFLPDGSVKFNLSHSGKYVALACGDSEIGVDIEMHGEFRENVAKRCFTEEERKWMYSQIDETAAFYKLWTGKEGLLKAMGTGFSLSAGEFSVLPTEDGLHTVGGKKWFFYWYDIEDYSLCVVSKSSERPHLTFVSKEILLK